jgi:hypothetical protein
MATNKIVQDILDDYSQKFIDALQDSIKKHDRLASGGLWESVKATTKVFGQSIVLEISMEDYWKFVDKGVDGWETKVGSEFKYTKAGKPIPLDAVKKFIASRGIGLKSMSIAKHKTLSSIKGKGKLSKKLKKAINTSQYDSIAWAMGYNIKKHGIKPTHFASDVMDGNLLDNFKKDITIAVGRNIKIEINRDIKQ